MLSPGIYPFIPCGDLSYRLRSSRPLSLLRKILRLFYGLKFSVSLFLGVLFLPEYPWAATQTYIPHVPAHTLGLHWIIPFVGILLSIAIVPLVAPKFWHKRHGMVSLFWAVVFLIPFTFVYGFDVALFESLHILLLDYIPFIILIGTLFTISGGIYIENDLEATPANNTLMITLGTILASFMEQQVPQWFSSVHCYELTKSDNTVHILLSFLFFWLQILAVL